MKIIILIDNISYKGWKLLKTIIPEKVKYKNMELCNPQNEIIYVDHLYSFCMKNGLCYEGMYQMASGKYFQYKGWKLAKNKQTQRFKKGKNVIIKNKLGELIQINNISKFVRENSLSRYKLTELLNGKINEYKNYKRF